MKWIGSRTFSVLGLAALLGAAGGCKNNATPVTLAQDPADANMAPVNGQPAYAAGSTRQAAVQPGRVLGERETGSPYQQGEQYPEGDSRSQPYDRDIDAGQEALDEADQAPPPLPEYAQPVATRPNTIWTPGYWRHAPGGYFWVPGAWVDPPYAGALWTPGYWGADGPRYRFHPGYWGRHVGFYGGIPYGGGYSGTGYRGGYWRGNQFYYNQAVNRVDPNAIREIYNQPEPVSYPYGRVSYNGGNGGIPLLPIAAEIIALHEQHQRPVRYQYDVERQAGLNQGQFYGVNRGRPETYIAPEGWVNRPVERREAVPQQVVVRRRVIVEREGPGRGNAYGHDKEKDHGEGRGQGDSHGDERKGHGDEGKDHGHGEGHGKG